jgi:Fe-S-cluster containining protein
MQSLCESSLKTILEDCRQCGACCKKYRKIPLRPDETAFISRMGGHVGVDISFMQIREKGMDAAVKEAKEKGRVFMIHPDDQGCVFLEKRDDKYRCRIYHYRPQTCRGFRCNMADTSFFSLFCDDAMHLLGKNTFGLPLKSLDK